MMEQIIFFAVGFFVACLLILTLIPFVHNSAVGLTMKRMEAAAPLSMAEIQADKDQLRAEFAMSTRRLELSVMNMKGKVTSQLAELGKKTDAINRLKVELHEKAAAVFSLQAREKSLADQLGATESELSVKVAALREAERMLQEKQAERARRTADLHERSASAHGQRIEATALRVTLEAFKDRASRHERDANELSDQLKRVRKEAAAVNAELREEVGKAENLSDRVAQLERQLVAQTTEAEVVRRRIQEAETRTIHLAKSLSQSEIEIAQLSDNIVENQRIETHLRADLSAASGRSQAARGGLIKEKALVEDQLTKAKAERTKLQQEIASMTRQADEALAAGRTESDQLRDGIIDIAAEFARLAIKLEGPDSPIESMLASEPVAPLANSERKPGVYRGHGGLAARIRASQAKPSRL